MSTSTVVLSDGNPCKVKRLGLFELDGRGREVLGPYRYSLLLATGQIVEDEYDLRALTYTPTPPDKPANEIEQGSAEWQQLEEYQTYLAALAHEKLRVESYEGYVTDIATYILDHCLDAADKNRLQDGDDWDKVYHAAIVPQLTAEGLTQCLRDTFPGFIWELGGNGRLATIGGWEGKNGGAETVGMRDDS